MAFVMLVHKATSTSVNELNTVFPRQLMLTEE